MLRWLRKKTSRYDATLKAARESKTGAYIEVIGGRMDMPKVLAFAHTRLKELYGATP